MRVQCEGIDQVASQRLPVAELADHWSQHVGHLHYRDFMPEIAGIAEEQAHLFS